MKTAAGIGLGLLAGFLLWVLLLGVRLTAHEPGLWTLRAARIIPCAVDYNGPPFTHGDHHLWLTCGGEDSGLQLWPLPR